MRFPALVFPLLLAAASLSSCDRVSTPGAQSAQQTGTTVQPMSAMTAASTPMPVAPSGQTNSSTAGLGNDLSNSTRASGGSNLYQPPSTDNAPSGGTAASPAPAARQGVSSQTRGTSPPPNDGTLPGGTEGNTGSRSGGGKG